MIIIELVKGVRIKIYVLLIVCIIALIGVSFFVFNRINDGRDGDISQEIKGIIGNYNEDETLSYRNFLINSFKTAVLEGGEGYVFGFKDKEVTISNFDLKSVSDIKSENYDYLFDCVDDMKKSTKLKNGDVVYVKSFYKNKNQGGGYYIISDELDENKISIKIATGLVAYLNIYGKTLYVSQLGSHGDGLADDYAYIQKSIDSCGDAIDTIIFDKGTYLCCDYINLINHKNITIIGNDSTIVVNNDFSNNKSNEFFLNVYKCNNILISGLDVRYEFTKEMSGIRSQLAINFSDGVELYNCHLSIPNSLRKVSECGYTNIDCYSGWHDIIINCCNFENYTDCDSGGGIWIRDLFNKGCDNLKLLNSSFTKIAHDEILAVFMGQISNVVIRNNNFIVPDDGESASVMNFTLGSNSSVQADDILFENNNIDVSSTGGLIWSKNTNNLLIRKNKIKIGLSSKAGANNANANFRVFESQSNTDGVTKLIDTIEDNEIEVYSNLESFDFQYKVFSRINIVKNNILIVNSKVTNIFVNCNNVIGNQVTCNNNVSFVSYNAINEFSNNSVILKGYTGCMFRWYGYSMSNIITCSNNYLEYQYEENDKSSCIVMINNTMFNGNYIDFKMNKIIGNKISSQTRQLFIVADDEEEQQFRSVGNNILNYPNRNYIVNAVIVNL